MSGYVRSLLANEAPAVKCLGRKLGWQIIDLVKAEQPDIICLQEVNDIDGPRDYLFASLDDIAEAAGLGYRYMSPVDRSRYQNAG